MDDMYVRFLASGNVVDLKPCDAAAALNAKLVERWISPEAKREIAMVRRDESTAAKFIDRG